MKTISFLATTFFVFSVLAACAPSSTPETVQQSTVKQPVAQTLVTDVAQETVSPVPTERAADTPPVAVATSRGDQLEATDPSTVNLSGGTPTLVEFFRFT